MAGALGADTEAAAGLGGQRERERERVGAVLRSEAARPRPPGCGAAPAGL